MVEGKAEAEAWAISQTSLQEVDKADSPLGSSSKHPSEKPVQARRIA